MIQVPHIYAEWVQVLKIFKNKSNDSEVLNAMSQGTIINHYQSGHALPNGMEKARVLAMRGGYDCIEVYTDCCRAISSNGAVSVITG